LLTEDRRTFVQDGTLLSNRLGQTLKCYYPVALEVIGEKLTTPMALEFLRRWPNLAQLQAAKPGTLRGFFYEQNSRSEDRIKERLAAIAQARPLTEDPALLEPLQQRMQGLVGQLRGLAKTLEHYDAEIRTVFKSLPLAHLFADLPGAGPALAPRLAAAFGTIHGNFPSVEDLLSFSGVAPVLVQSGATQRVHFRYARPIFLHQSFVEFAKCSIPKCEWARLLYEHELKQGKKKWVAIRKVAFKWIRILWRCWRDGKAYDETTYLRSLQRHGVTLYQSLYEQLPPAQGSAVNNS
jgi:transposase